MSTSAYPLAWPDGWPRTPTDERSPGTQFKHGSRLYGEQVRPISLEAACRKLFGELGRMEVSGVVLSSNVPLRSDGMPRADAARYRMDDPGVALYFTFRGRSLAMASDRYDNPAANVRSLGLAIEAMRQLDRHGGGAMVERAFSGFAALPPPVSYWKVLGVPPGSSADVVDAAYRKLAKTLHPDLGGPPGAMAEINHARDQALKGATQ